jgi:hypothetical protein
MVPFVGHRSNATVAHSRGCNSLDRLSRQAKVAPVIVGAAVIALLASAHSSVRAAEDPSRMVQEHHACAVVMGLHQPGALYDTCVRSLDKSLSESDEVRLAKGNRNACAESGFTPGTRAFAVCAVTEEQ